VTPTPELRQALQAIIAPRPLIYVDCGARAGKLPKEFRSLEGSVYVGFEADAAECARLNETARPGQRYVCAFLGRRREQRTFHVTSSAACSSLLAPDPSFVAPFMDLREPFRVEREVLVNTVPLGDALTAEGISYVDFLELDTQGSEIEILEGAVDLLRGSVLGVKVEVEFSAMYVNQPLFADIDAFMRQHDFQLFDLSRYRVRREGLDPRIATRGQLLWGHALYLRNDAQLAVAAACRLAAVSTLVDLPDYAYSVLGRVAAATEPDVRSRAQHVRDALGRNAAVPDDSPLAASRHRAQWKD
jgi:FkbM family methyltransferase